MSHFHQVPLRVLPVEHPEADLAAAFQGDLLPDLWHTTNSVASIRSSPQLVNTQLYKTELCASYGNKCQFAHGENELKQVERPPKWRSKPCANWSKFGTCRYGNRCCFKHE
ncbi:uncharacterized protein CANTADRAFT_147470 [Suhomyces tanzawaensis NRRL Y-17324]|uniref:C3H1-type domain-containing protein n=1 Tax=Suhomyces tanzawaensis NRRL Y-17324 TaxID=984487 RepID=A0A1E4SSI7_9ASCO|nr:uncharacterized protein CANTADRAFT_147470 [Suhomyces tanzawaensis NRRL Y-17324]ODV82483.1 hypothetical protein CANTADRAFT_147470 [Suhomyces tanzawaensis NRRL Y-17324]